MNEEPDEEKKPEEPVSDNRIKEHLVSAEKALDRKDYAAARCEVLQAMEITREIQEKLAADTLASAQFKSRYASNIGADVSEAQDRLDNATRALAAKDYEKAILMALEARGKAERAKERYKELVDLIYETEKLISEAHATGKDTAEAERHLSKAVSLKSANGNKARAVAVEARAAANQALGRSGTPIQMAAGSEVPPPWGLADAGRDRPETTSPGEQDERYQDFVQAMKDVNNAIHQARDKGVNTDRAVELHYLATKTGREYKSDAPSALPKAMKLLQECRRSLEEAIATSSPNIGAQLNLKGLLKSAFSYNEWNEATLVLSNTGQTYAKDIAVSVWGDFELQLYWPIPFLRAGQSRTTEVRLRPRRMGETSLELIIRYKRALDDKEMESRIKIDLVVK